MSRTMARTRPRIPVSRRALQQRIDRVLSKRKEKLKSYRVGSVKTGEFFVVNLERGVVTRERFADLEGYGRELGVINQWEAYA